MERNISKDICDKIVNIFPKDNTLAIIVFGSYGTDKQRLDSDIDIAWVVRERPKDYPLSEYSRLLNQLLNIEIDLFIVTESYPVELKYNILNGSVLYETEDFEDYLGKFYVDASDLLDIMFWRINDANN